jgi:hypothetical protein
MVTTIILALRDAAASPTVKIYRTALRAEWAGYCNDRHAALPDLGRCGSERRQLESAPFGEWSVVRAALAREQHREPSRFAVSGSCVDGTARVGGLENDQLDVPCSHGRV